MFTIRVKDKIIKADRERLAFLINSQPNSPLAYCEFKSEKIPGIYARLDRSRKFVSGIVLKIERKDKVLRLRINIPDVCEVENELCFVDRDGTGYVKVSTLINNIVSEEPFEVFFQFRLNNKEEPFFMVPGVLYGTNNERISKGTQPQLLYRSDKVNLPKSPSWHFRTDRSSLPFSGAFYDGRVFCAGIDEVYKFDKGLWGYNSIGLWTSKKEGDRVSVSVGSLDYPARLKNFKYTDYDIAEGIGVDSKKVHTNIYLYWNEAKNRFCFEEFMRAFYYEIHEYPRVVVDRKQALCDLVKGIMEATNPKTGFFYTLISEPTVVSFHDSHGDCDTSYCGITQIAQPLLEAAIKCRRDDAIKYARGVLNRVVNEALNEKANLFFDAYLEEKRWSVNRWGHGYRHSAYINGQCCYFLIKSYQREKSRGLNRKGWLIPVTRVLRQAVSTQSDDGHFGINFSDKDGHVLGYEGFAGCWFVPPLIMLYTEDKTQKWAIDSALRAIEAYYSDLKTYELLGSPMETYKAPDEEGILAFIKGVVEIHKMTKEAKYLGMLSHALHYNFTFKFAYNTHHRYNKICNWSSSGGDLTDVHNIHIHAYGNLVAEDIYYYYKETNDRYFYDRLCDTIQWGLQAYNHYDNEFGYGRIGWTSEQFYHTYVDYHGDYADGGTWHAFLPWANGTLLSSLTGDIPDDFIDGIVNEAEKNDGMIGNIVESPNY